MPQASRDNTDSSSNDSGSGSGSDDQQDGSGQDEDELDAVAIWTRHDPEQFLPDGPRSQFRGALPIDEDAGWTVVGSVFDFESTQATAATWETTDPTSGSWTRTDVAPSGEDDETMIGVARAGGLEIAVGSRGEIGNLQPAVWSRTVGGPWVSFSSSQLVSDDSEYIHSLAVSDDQQAVMAIGLVETSEAVDVPTLWRSADGKSWRRSGTPQFATDGSEAVTGIAAGPDRWVMAGRRTLPDGTFVPTVWHSIDGSRWTSVELPMGVTDIRGNANDVVWADGQFVIVGETAVEFASEPRSWVSPNGVEWTDPSSDFGLNLSGRVTSAGFGAGKVAASGGRLVATGTDGFVQQIWQSTNGRSWSPVGDIWELRTNGVLAEALAVTGNELLLATGDQALLHYGSTWQTSPVSNAVAPAPSEAPFVNQVVAVDAGFVAVGGFERSLPDEGTWFEGRSWLSPDGVSWEQMQPQERTEWGHISAVTDIDGQPVAVGGQSLRDADIKSESAQSMLWEGNGSGWTVREDRALATPNVGRVFLQAVAYDGTDLIAGGWSFQNEAAAADAYLLTSVDGAELEVVDTGHSSAADESIDAICSDGAGNSVALLRVSDATSRTAALVRSPNGVWADATASDGSFEFAPLIQVNACRYSNGRFLAAGWASQDRVSTDVSLWQSTDGASWTGLNGPPAFTAEGDQWIASVAAIDDGFLMVGIDTASGLPQPTLWYGDGAGASWTPIAFGEDAIGMDFPYIAVRDNTVLVIGTLDGATRSYTTTLDQVKRVASQ